MILQEAVNIEQAATEIEKARIISQVLNDFLPEYFELRISADAGREAGSILLEENLSSAFDVEIDATRVSPYI